LVEKTSTAAKRAIKAFRSGKLKSRPAEQLIASLRKANKDH